MNKRELCLKIYCEAFGEDEPDFASLLFDSCFEQCVLCEAENEIASMFFALECEIVTRTKTIPAIYIFAAATNKKFRSKGFMTRLLEEYKNTVADNTVIFLRPANEGLINFYRNCGFKEITGINNNSSLPLVKPLGSFAKLTENILNGDGKEFTLMYYSKAQKITEDLHFIYSME